MTSNLLGNRYQVIRSLSSGGFGDTYLAEDQHSPTKRRCVIKKLHPINEEAQTYQMVQERFDREAAILEDLGSHHPQIPTLYAYFEEDGLFYLVEEWVEGSTLSEIVAREGVQSEGSVKELLSSLLPVLDYVHSKRIVHRDIKPDNIILRVGDRVPVLIDFGAVKETMSSTMTPSGKSTRSIVVGTPGFMASEQSVGRPVYASDLYSLGLTAVYLLTGKIPQYLASDPATGEISWRQYAPRVSPTLGNVLDKAIQMSYRDRYHNASEMLAALQLSPTIPVSPAIPPTIASAPPPQSPTVVSTPAAGTTPSYVASSNRGTLSEWQKALITGSVVGIFAVAAIVLVQVSDLFNSKDNGSEEANNSEATPESIDTDEEISSPDPGATPDSPSPSPTATSPPSPSPTQTPPYQPPPQQTISQDDAVQLINNWQGYKRRLFAPPYDRSRGSDLLTGVAYSKNIRRTDGQQSSVDWLIDNNAHYTYGVQKIDSVERIVGDSKFASVIVVLTEQRTLYVGGKPSQDKNSGLDVLRVNYSLQRQGGRWKIADYKTETLSHQ